MAFALRLEITDRNDDLRFGLSDGSRREEGERAKKSSGHAAGLPKEATLVNRATTARLGMTRD